MPQKSAILWGWGKVFGTRVVFPFQLLNQFFNFHETSYDHYAYSSIYNRFFKKEFNLFLMIDSYFKNMPVLRTVTAPPKKKHW
jgi:hypothetical protein